MYHHLNIFIMNYHHKLRCTKNKLNMIEEINPDKLKFIKIIFSELTFLLSKYDEKKIKSTYELNYIFENSINFVKNIIFRTNDFFFYFLLLGQDSYLDEISDFFQKVIGQVPSLKKYQDLLNKYLELIYKQRIIKIKETEGMFRMICSSIDKVKNNEDLKKFVSKKKKYLIEYKF